MSPDYKDLGISNADTQLEQRITEACAQLSLCKSRDEAWPHWCEFCRLIESGSEAAVERLERIKGLRK